MIAGNKRRLPTRQATISASFAKGLVDLAAQKGAKPEFLLRRGGIAADELDDPDNRIPFAKYVALTRAGQELTGDPALALHFGEAYEMAELSIVALLAQCCETMAEAMMQLERFGRLIADVEVDDPNGRRLVFRREGNRVWLVDTRKNPNEFPEMTESGFARMAAASRRRTSGVPDLVREVHVTHKAPSYRDEYTRVFQLPVVFESDRNALLMADDSVLTMKVPNRPPRYVFGLLSERVEALLEDLEATDTARGRVERSLMLVLHKGDANIDAIAAQLGTTRQTLYRHLKAEGTTFERVLDELRHRLAADYLQSRKVSVNQTAYLVGFSDPAAFSRAFKRWTGMSPREARLSQQS